jgi:hypothetical protein
MNCYFLDGRTLLETMAELSTAQPLITSTSDFSSFYPLGIGMLIILHVTCVKQ